MSILSIFGKFRNKNKVTKETVVRAEVPFVHAHTLILGCKDAWTAYDAGRNSNYQNSFECADGSKVNVSLDSCGDFGPNVAVQYFGKSEKGFVSTECSRIYNDDIRLPGGLSVEIKNNLPFSQSTIKTAKTMENPNGGGRS